MYAFATHSVHLTGPCVSEVTAYDGANWLTIKDDRGRELVTFFAANKHRNTLFRIAALFNKISNPRHAAEERAPSPTPHTLAAAPEPFVTLAEPDEPDGDVGFGR